MVARFFQVAGIGVGVLAALAALAALGVFAVSGSRLGRSYDVAVAPLPIPTDGAALERGRHLAVAATHCTGCHGDNLAGRVMIDAPPFLVVAPNLTRGAGGVGAMSDADWVRAIRHGVAPDGTSLMIMPSRDYQGLSAEDLAAIIAYVRSVPPVDSNLPGSELRPLGRALLTFGQLEVLEAERIDHGAPIPPAVPAGPTPEYGAYLTTVGGCRTCHGGDLAGGVVPDGSGLRGPNITSAGLPAWTEADFVRAMRSGVDPSGAPISEVMPWRSVGQLSDDELRALWAYMQSK